MRMYLEKRDQLSLAISLGELLDPIDYIVQTSFSDGDSVFWESHLPDGTRHGNFLQKTIFPNTGGYRKIVSRDYEFGKLHGNFSFSVGEEADYDNIFCKAKFSRGVPLGSVFACVSQSLGDYYGVILDDCVEEFQVRAFFDSSGLPVKFERFTGKSYSQAVLEWEDGNVTINGKKYTLVCFSNEESFFEYGVLVEGGWLLAEVFEGVCPLVTAFDEEGRKVRIEMPVFVSCLTEK